MIKAYSFLPAATQIIYDLGLEEYLHAVTFECPEVALKEKQRVVRCVLEGNSYSSQEIDRIFSASKAQGKSLYYVDEEVLQQISPDVIFTQDVCEVCQIDTACTAASVAKLPKQPRLVSLSPNNLNDVFETVVTIASALGREEVAYTYLAELHSRLGFLVDEQRKHRVMPKRVMLMEWVAPIYNCGHWIPYQIAFAGGIDMLSNPAGDSIVTPWEKIVKYDPEVLVIAPCGFNITRTLQEIELLTQKPEWQQLQAVQNKAVYIADFDMFTQPSASTLVDGIEVLASVFHPEVFTTPDNLKHKVQPLYDLQNAKIKV